LGTTSALLQHSAINPRRLSGGLPFLQCDTSELRESGPPEEMNIFGLRGLLRKAESLHIPCGLDGIRDSMGVHGCDTGLSRLTCITQRRDKPHVRSMECAVHVGFSRSRTKP
jgi:hypothetical protein